MRLNKYIAAASELSRRSADEAIATERVNVNGQPGILGQSVQTDDTVTLDGAPLRLPADHIYVMLHKPVGVVVSRAHQDSSQTVYDILPPEYRQLIAVGRLDKDSSGLLLLTNDGQFAQRATHPSFEKQKTYEVTLNRQFAQADAEILQNGIALEDGLSRLAIEQLDGKRLVVSLHEGRNRQVRRTFEALGYRVVNLHRSGFGPYVLGSLEVGATAVVDGRAL